MSGADGTRASRILLVEDHVSFREALAHALDGQPGLSVVAQAGSLAEARAALAGIDVAVLDLGLPDGEGIELIPELHAANLRCPVLILSASVDPVQHARAVEAGAVSVVHKSCGLSEIVDATRSLGEGEIPFSTENDELLCLASRTRKRDREARQEAERITRRELEVLQALSEGLENAQIAQRLGMTIHTERTHMVHIQNKLGARSRLEALVLAVRCGAVELTAERSYAC